MRFQLLDPVVLARDLPEHGLRAGLLGAIVHVHEPDWLEVEFFDESGETEAVVPVRDSDLRPVEQDDLPSSRRMRRSA
jgi:hypothetical protein